MSINSVGEFVIVCDSRAKWGLRWKIGAWVKLWWIEYWRGVAGFSLLSHPLGYCSRVGWWLFCGGYE